MIDLLGYVAGVLTTVAFLPQAVKTLRTKSTKDISLAMWSLLCSGVFCWLIYGIAVGAGPVIAANAVTLLVATVILLLKIIHG